MVPTTASLLPAKISRVPVTPAPKLAMLPEEYNSYLATELQNSESIPTEILIKNIIGKSHVGLMCPQLPYAVNHDVIPSYKGTPTMAAQLIVARIGQRSISS